MSSVQFDLCGSVGGFYADLCGGWLLPSTAPQVSFLTRKQRLLISSQAQDKLKAVQDILYFEGD